MRKNRAVQVVVAMAFAIAITMDNGCSILATRPVQDMSDTAAALRAAREVQADTLAPEMYREASEYWLKARREYKFKNFHYAEEYARKARSLAEQAEYEALRNGGNRVENIPDPMAAEGAGPPPPPSNAQPAPIPTQNLSDQAPTPRGTPVEDYAADKAADDAKKGKDVNQAPSIDVNPTTVNQVYAPYPAPAPPSATSGTTSGGTTTTPPAGTTPAP